MINYLLQCILTRYNIRYKGSDIILDTGIGDNNNIVQIDCRFLKDVIE